MEILESPAPDVAAGQVTGGSLDGGFRSFDATKPKRGSGTYWLKLKFAADAPGDGTLAPILNVRQGRQSAIQPFVHDGAAAVPLRLAAHLPGFLGVQESVFILPDEFTPDRPVYVRVQALGPDAEPVHFSTSTLDLTLARGAEHARMIAFTFGALVAMSLTALLIWFVLADRLLLLYASLFSLQALYMAFLSGQAFEWPVLSLALPLISYTWNVTAALSGAVACLFVREIAELQRFSPRVYKVFGWLAVTFAVLMFANVAQLVGLGEIVAAIGNLVFAGSAIFTLVVAFLAWRRSSRAAGWFLVAWGLLETFTIATAVRLLFSEPEKAEGLLYYGLPLSMVAAAVFVALGVADRLRDQRLALSDAERRAQTDPLTGVLNRRSLVERLEAASLRARARGLPISVLFIDLDHFKEINDSHGHAAGDACLRAIIDPIQAELRQSDVVGRYGGEEFVVILSSADAAAAEPVAERICNRVAELRIEGFETSIRMTCSIGVATSETSGAWGEQLIAHADAAVYAAKRSGRNRVKFAVPIAA